MLVLHVARLQRLQSPGPVQRKMATVAMDAARELEDVATHLENMTEEDWGTEFSYF